MSKKNNISKRKRDNEHLKRREAEIARKRAEKRARRKQAREQNTDEVMIDAAAAVDVSSSETKPLESSPLIKLTTKKKVLRRRLNEIKRLAIKREITRKQEAQLNAQVQVNLAALESS